MQTIDLILEIERLPKAQKLQVMEEIIKLIKKDDARHQMEMAAQELYSDYLNDKELTAFSSLDLENFYETK
jgi:hypothetical protein